MSEAKDQALAIDVRLKCSDSSSRPYISNCTNVSVAQGIAYVDFWFIEPSMLGAIATCSKNGEAAPKSIDGQIVTRIAMGVDVLARLYGQIREVLMELRDVREAKEKTETGNYNK